MFKLCTYSFQGGSAFPRGSFSDHLLELISDITDKPERPVFLCIGTDRSTGDSLGPLIGHFLKQYQSPLFSVYGTLTHPIHAMNLLPSLEEIYKNHAGSPLIAIDASLGSVERVGSITLSRRPLRPGLGVNKSLPGIGDISITGVIGTTQMNDPLQLQSVRLSMVMDMATNIAEGILSLCVPGGILHQKRTSIPYDLPAKTKRSLG